VAAWIPSLALAAHLVPAQQLERRDRRGRLPSGAAPLDELIGGGWPRAALSELAGGRSTGRTSLLLATIGASLRRGETVGLVDVGGTLDPRLAARAGVPLSRLLWIRCGADKALAAAELVVAAGGFALVALDLGEERPRTEDRRDRRGAGAAASASWMRLKRAAEQQGSAVLLSSARRMPGALGSCAVTLSQPQPRFQDTPLLLLGVTASAAVERGGDTAAAPRLTFAHQK
jgi:RecA/RadA recombinase